MQVKGIVACSGGKMSGSRFGEREEDQFKEWENVDIQISCVTVYAAKVRQAKAQRKCSPKGIRNCRIQEKNFSSSYFKRREGHSNQEKRWFKAGRDWRLKYFLECLLQGVSWKILQRLWFLPSSLICRSEPKCPAPWIVSQTVSTFHKAKVTERSTW